MSGSSDVWPRHVDRLKPLHLARAVTVVPMPRCVHGRRPDCVTDAAQSPPARRHCEFPPLQAAPTGEDVALQGRLRAPRRLARDSGGSVALPPLRAPRRRRGPEGPSKRLPCQHCRRKRLFPKGGRGGIRTHETLTRLPVFKTVPEVTTRSSSKERKTKPPASLLRRRGTGRRQDLCAEMRHALPFAATPGTSW
jgi:hypothetical protein